MSEFEPKLPVLGEDIAPEVMVLLSQTGCVEGCADDAGGGERGWGAMSNLRALPHT